MTTLIISIYQKGLSVLLSLGLILFTVNVWASCSKVELYLKAEVGKDYRAAVFKNQTLGSQRIEEKSVYDDGKYQLVATDKNKVGCIPGGATTQGSVYVKIRPKESSSDVLEKVLINYRFNPKEGIMTCKASAGSYVRSTTQKPNLNGETMQCYTTITKIN